MIAAFVYDDYYCWGIRQNFRGHYGDIEEATSILRGGRWENQNLELFDLDNGEWRKYKWEPYYEYTSEWVDDATSPTGTRKRYFIQRRWTKEPAEKIRKIR